MSELIARLRAVVRRRSPLAPDVLRAGSLSLNTVTHACSVGSESVTLSKREYALLAALMTRPGAILSSAPSKRSSMRRATSPRAMQSNT